MSKKIKITPLRDEVILKPIKEGEKKTEGGIVIPDAGNKKESSERGLVVAVGPGRITEEGEVIPPQVQQGDQVLFIKYLPIEVEIKNELYLIAKQDHIVAVCEEMEGSKKENGNTKD